MVFGNIVNISHFSGTLSNKNFSNSVTAAWKNGTPASPGRNVLPVPDEPKRKTHFGRFPLRAETLNFQKLTTYFNSFFASSAPVSVISISSTFTSISHHSSKYSKNYDYRRVFWKILSLVRVRPGVLNKFRKILFET